MVRWEDESSRVTDGPETSAGRKRLTRQEQREQTRQRLLESAQRLFALQGVAGASIDEIAEDAGYSRGAFYSNYRDKLDLLGELMDSGFDGDIAGVRQMPRDGDEAALAAAFARISNAFAGANSNATWMLEFQLAGVRHPELAPRYLAQFDQLRDAVADLVAAHRSANGQPAPRHPQIVADAFIVLLSGLSLLRTLEPERYSGEAVQTVFLSLVRGLTD